ncbi:MAG: Terminase-like family protein [Chlorobi bacterium OLB5]|nr:MAG: Terminase-like family protein [Chlorobi bacterium OLB5]
MCHKLELFSTGIIKNLMVFMPPQHGKSELVSRRLPAYMLGRNPNLKFVGASYSSELSKSFNRDCQRIMKSSEYSEIFRLSDNKDVSKFRYAERADYFEIVGYEGSYRSVGVDGAITGFRADIFSIDDPVKGYKEAMSPTEREHAWNFYNAIVETRCHNKTQKMLTMTRWHEDDLAGKIILADYDRLQQKAYNLKYIDVLIDKDSLSFTELIGEYKMLCDLFPDDILKWDIVIFPAVKEDASNPDDPRKIGEALWEEMHSLERLDNIKLKAPQIFVSLYQQRPAPEEGDIIKAAWFKTFKSTDLPKEVTKDFYSDTGYGKQKSDKSATGCYTLHEGNMYIWDLSVVNLPFPKFITNYKDFITRNGYSYKSECAFEPKATGISCVQQLKVEKLDNGKYINIVEDKPPKDDKVTRAKSITPILAAGRVHLLEGASWIQAFLLECKQFPNGKNDDQVDFLTGVLNRRFGDELTGIRITIIKKKEPET